MNIPREITGKTCTCPHDSPGIDMGLQWSTKGGKHKPLTMERCQFKSEKLNTRYEKKPITANGKTSLTRRHLAIKPYTRLITHIQSGPTGLQHLRPLHDITQVSPNHAKCPSLEQKLHTHPIRKHNRKLARSRKRMLPQDTPS